MDTLFQHFRRCHCHRCSLYLKAPSTRNCEPRVKKYVSHSAARPLCTVLASLAGRMYGAAAGGARARMREGCTLMLHAPHNFYLEGGNMGAWSHERKLFHKPQIACVQRTYLSIGPANTYSYESTNLSRGKGGGGMTDGTQCYRTF